MFITLRCERCEQCSFFDEKVLEAGPQLAPWLKQFITVRMTDASKLDFNRLPVQGFQDMDLSWWGWFLSAQGHVYSVFGGRDHISDKTRISEAALIATMKRILNHHYHPNRLEWNIDGLSYTPQPELKPMKLPGYQSWLSKRHDTSEPECLHCHQVIEILRQPAIDAGTFDKDQDLRIWPLPENVGITVDRKGEIVWQKPLGEFKKLTERGIPPTGQENFGGATVTDSGLIIIASTMDEYIRVFNEQTGEVLYKSKLEAGGYAAPVTYLGEDGKQ